MACGILGYSNKDKGAWQGMQHAWVRSGIRAKLYLEWLNERDHFAD